jgi:hypothetical protein
MNPPPGASGGHHGSIGEFPREVGEDDDSDSHEDRDQWDAARGRSGPDTSGPGLAGAVSPGASAGRPGPAGSVIIFSLLWVRRQAYPR